MKTLSICLTAAALSIVLSQPASALGSIPILVFPENGSPSTDIVTRTCSGVATPCPDKN